MSLRLALLACVAAWLTPASSALTPATLLNPQLESQSINLSGLSGGTLSFFDDQRRLTRASVQDYVRLTLSPEDPPAVLAPSGVIELVDGQRLAGRWAAASSDGEAIVWIHPSLGRFTLGLDDIRRVVIDEQAAASALSVPLDAATAGGDTLRLRNGDQLVGFIVAVDDGSVTILPDGADGEVTLTIDTIAAVTLANPLTPPGDVAVAGDLVVLADGSRVRGGGVAIQHQTLRFTPTLTDAMQPVDVDLSGVRQIDFAAAGLRLVDLGEQPMQTIAGGSAFGLDLSPTVDGEGIRLHAPVTVVFELPDGAQRFTSRAVLDLPAGLPEARAALADVVVSSGPGESVSASSSSDAVARLLAENPWSVIRAELNGAKRLWLELDPSRNGPILDRVLLRDAVVLIETTDPLAGSGDADP